ncbi:MAG TPA: HipA family kinase [Candidatus Kapabacteria bacterium]|nr:HipA family kinase [Candidatus Kapabacteria bacterium]
MLEILQATRYVTPLREGGSLPALVEADDYGLYVLKFRGAGQGTKALIAELIAGELGRALGLPVPRLAFMLLDPTLGRNEPDYEIRTLIEASGGLNFAMDYLPGSISFDPLANHVDPELASEIVWFDAYIMNVDRTARNTNMLIWHKKLYLIDHGASLFFHHQWTSAEEKIGSPFNNIKDHVLLRMATALPEAGRKLKSMITSELIHSIVSLIPDDWLESNAVFENPHSHREGYANFLEQRLASSHSFEQEAIRARNNL